SEVKTPLSKSRTPSNIAILVPSHDHWPASELLASRPKSVPSGSTVKVCSSAVAELSARLIRILPLVPRGLADAGAALMAATATMASTPHKKVVDRRNLPPLVVRGPPPPATSPGPGSERGHS